MFPPKTVPGQLADALANINSPSVLRIADWLSTYRTLTLKETFRFNRFSTISVTFSVSNKSKYQSKANSGLSNIGFALFRVFGDSTLIFGHFYR